MPKATLYDTWPPYFVGDMVAPFYHTEAAVFNSSIYQRYPDRYAAVFIFIHIGPVSMEWHLIPGVSRLDHEIGKDRTVAVQQCRYTRENLSRDGIIYFSLIALVSAEMRCVEAAIVLLHISLYQAVKGCDAAAIQSRIDGITLLGHLLAELCIMEYSVHGIIKILILETMLLA